MIDYQNDFVDPKGKLYVKGAEKLLPKINNYIRNFVGPVYASKDWHPKGHISFNQWGEHCVVETKDNKPDEYIWYKSSWGADFYPDLLDDGMTIYKGFKKDEDSYSIFGGTNFDKEWLNGLLKERGVTHIIIIGVATDYCIKASALDAIKFGYKTTVLTDLIAGVDPKTTNEALGEMYLAGVELKESDS